MGCERREQMREMGVDTDVYCATCTPDPVTKQCSGLVELMIDVNLLIKYEMDGYEDIVVGS